MFVIRSLLEVSNMATYSFSHSVSHAFDLWRQDDKGNRFLDSSFPNRASAEMRLAELKRVRHKHVFWIAERSKNGE